MYQRVWHVSVYTREKSRIHNCADTSAKQSCRHLEQNTTWLAARVRSCSVPRPQPSEFDAKPCLNRTYWNCIAYMKCQILYTHILNILWSYMKYKNCQHIKYILKTSSTFTTLSAQHWWLSIRRQVLCQDQLNGPRENVLLLLGRSTVGISHLKFKNAKRPNVCRNISKK